jgi:hypothetical protein
MRVIGVLGWAGPDGGWVPPALDRRVAAAEDPQERQGNGAQYVWIAPGEFTSYGLPGDGLRRSTRRSRSPGALTKGFWMGQTEGDGGRLTRSSRSHRPGGSRRSQDFRAAASQSGLVARGLAHGRRSLRRGPSVLPVDRAPLAFRPRAEWGVRRPRRHLRRHLWRRRAHLVELRQQRPRLDSAKALKEAGRRRRKEDARRAQGERGTHLAARRQEGAHAFACTTRSANVLEWVSELPAPGARGPANGDGSTGSRRRRTRRADAWKARGSRLAQPPSRGRARPRGAPTTAATSSASAVSRSGPHPMRPRTL